MANSSSRGKLRSPGRRRGEGPTEPALPAWKAFVVQFSDETGSATGAFSGRAEHLSTGQRARFESAQELTEFIQAVLRQPASISRRGS
jgi:hypothetical protein